METRRNAALGITNASTNSTPGAEDNVSTQIEVVNSNSNNITVPPHDPNAAPRGIIYDTNPSTVGESSNSSARSRDAIASAATTDEQIDRLRELFQPNSTDPRVQTIMQMLRDGLPLIQPVAMNLPRPADAFIRTSGAPIFFQDLFRINFAQRS
jgi:hypothetical protein